MSTGTQAQVPRRPLHIAAIYCLTLSALPCLANQAGPAADPLTFVEGLACQGGKLSLRLPSTLPGLLALAARHGEKKLETQRWEGYTTTRTQVLFDGLAVDLVTYSNDPNKYSLERATIRSAAWAKLAPFAVGEDIDAVRATLGDLAKDDWQLRSVYSSENESIRFETTKAGKVSAIIYECYTG